MFHYLYSISRKIFSLIVNINIMYSLLTFKSSTFFYQPFKKHNLLAVAIITLLFADFCVALLKINKISIPRLVENGTEDSVVLDCDYTFDIDDKKLVLKWFLNDDPEPIYQFIAELGTRHASSRLRGRINLDYAVGGDPLIKYRALNLLRPTVDLSGRYSCHVQSLQSHDSKEESMIIYATPKDIEFSYKSVTRKEFSSALHNNKNNNNNNNHNNHNNHILSHNSFASAQQPYSSELSCKVSDVFPMPELTIYRVAQDGSHPRTLDLYSTENKLMSNGAYNASVSVFINDRELIEKYGNEASIFECLVVLSELDLEKRKRIQYFPVNEELRNLSAESKVHFVFAIFYTIMSLTLI